MIKATAIIFSAMLFISMVAKASSPENITFTGSYELTLNDRLGGLYYHEKIVDTPEGFLLSMSLEPHDEKHGKHHSCEQISRFIINDLVQNGIIDPETGDEVVDEMEFMEAYKTAFLDHAFDVRPFADDWQDFFQAVQDFYFTHCGLNRFENVSLWFLDPPNEDLMMDAEFRPLSKTLDSGLFQQHDRQLLQVNYTVEGISYHMKMKGVEDINEVYETDKIIYDPLQLFFLLSSFNYHERFRQELHFVNLSALVLSDDYGQRITGPGVQAERNFYEYDVSIRVTGTKNLVLDGNSTRVWVVEVKGFNPKYHPLFNVYDHYLRSSDDLRIYVDKENGNILRVEALRHDRPVSILYSQQ